MLKVFVLVLLLAGGLRFTALTFDSLWLDESYQTVVESYGNALPDFFHCSGTAFIYKPDNPASVKGLLCEFRKVDPLCPPLYAILINRWLTIFGGSDLALRAFSVLCSLLSVAATYFFGSLLLGKRAAIYASLLQTISPFDISYAQEARMYSLCTLLATISGGSLLYLSLKKNTRIRLIYGTLYVFSTWALINTHYTQLFFWAFTILVGLTIAFLRKDLVLSITLIIANICILALCLPWVPLFMQAFSIQTASFYVVRQPSLFWPIWALIARIPFNWLVFLAGKKVMVWALPAYITSSILLLSSLPSLFKYLKSARTKTLPALTAPSINFSVFLLFLWAIVPALMIWTLDVIESHRVIEISRYLIGTTPAIFLLAGHALTLVSIKRILLPLTAIHATFCLANNAYLHIVPQKENWRQVAQLIEQSIKPNETLFVSNYYNIVCLDRYLHQPIKQIGIGPSMGKAAVEKSLQSANSSHSFWLLSAQEGDAIFNDIPPIYVVQQKYDFPHALHLRQYRQK